MCGIFGVCGEPADRPESLGVLRAMGKALIHRGPDDQGTHMEPGVGIGMRRLSIIDLKTGHQPLANEDGSIWTVFNGEIYNYRELTAGLLARGHRFATASDTETLVHLYEEHGADCVRHLRGMFAFALGMRGGTRCYWRGIAWGSSRSTTPRLRTASSSAPN